ncbi:MAG: DUF5655 domain-containing protein [Acidimicrobiales bacterium]
MPPWTCPSCARQFGRTNQSHECSPAMTLEDYFSTGPERERPIFEAVAGYLETLGPIHVEPVSVGIFIKRDRSFVELRPKVRWVALSFPLPYVIDHARIARRMRSGGTCYHVVNMVGPEDVDEQVEAWLAEAWFAHG